MRSCSLKAFMNTKTNQEATETTLELSVPAKNPTLYRYGATDDVLGVLVDSPYEEFTARGLSRLTDHSIGSVTETLNVLEENGLIRTRPEGNRKPVRINRERLSKPDDPVLRIPQTGFHLPVREALERLRGELDNVSGVVVFGSVARGDADRKSDVDLFVLVEEEQATNQRKAHETARDLENERFDGERYGFEILVESVDSAEEYGDKLRDVFASGITLYETDELRTVKREVLENA